MRDAKKRTRTIRSRRINVSKPLSLNGKKPMRGLLGSLIGDPKRPKGTSPNQAHRPAECFRARISAVIARLVDPQSRRALPTQYKCVHGYPDTTKRMAQPINQINAPIRIEIPIPVRSATWVNTLASMIAVRPTAAIAQTQ